VNQDSCQEFFELLPIVAVGEVDSKELDHVLDHVGQCELCLSRLEEERWLAEMASAHIPSWELAGFAQGLAPEDLSREVILEHLAVCQSCREEVSFAMMDRISEFEAFQQKKGLRESRGQAWKVVSAAAAAVLLIVALTYLSFRPSEQLGSQVLVSKAPSSATGQAALESGPNQQHQPASVPLFSSGFESGDPAGWTQ